MLATSTAVPSSPLGKGIPVAVPEDASLTQDVSPFELVRTADTPSSKHFPHSSYNQPVQQQKKPGLFACCFRGSRADEEPTEPAAAAGGHAALHTHGSLPLASTGSLQKRLSRRDSTKRPIFRKMGSLAYSDVDWFDAHSRFEGFSGDHADLLAEVDQLSRQVSIAQHGPWVPDPPLRFAGDMPQRFLPYPLDVSRFVGYWARDYDRSTPPPQPIDVMLGVNFFTKKVHNSIPGALISETDKELTMMVKPGIVPPGLNRYTETLDHINGTGTSWLLRRDLKAGSSSGRVYMAVDGTVVVRIEGKGFMSSTVDTIVEEYWRLEEGGTVLVARQCALHIPTGKTATQFLVGIKQPHPPKGWV